MQPGCAPTARLFSSLNHVIGPDCFPPQIPGCRPIDQYNIAWICVI